MLAQLTAASKLKLSAKDYSCKILEGFGDSLQIVKAIALEAKHIEEQCSSGRKGYDDVSKILIENGFEQVYFKKYVTQSDSLWVQKHYLQEPRYPKKFLCSKECRKIQKKENILEYDHLEYLEYVFPYVDSKEKYTIEPGFLRGATTWTAEVDLKYKKSISFILDSKTFYSDAIGVSVLEDMLQDDNLIITEEQKQRAIFICSYNCYINF